MRTSRRSAPQDPALLLAEVARHWPMAKGSLAEVRKPCVRPGCRACASGRKHPAFLFSFTDQGRRRCRYVPRDLVPALRQAIANGRWMESNPVLVTAYCVMALEQIYYSIPGEP